MKLWDVLVTFLLLLSSVSTRPIFPKLQPVKRPPVLGLHRDSVALSMEDSLIQPYSQAERLHKTSMEEQCKCAALPLLLRLSYKHQISSNRKGKHLFLIISKKHLQLYYLVNLRKTKVAVM